MFMLEKYYNHVIKVDLINKYSHVNFKEIPKIEKIILNFGCKNSDLFEISSALLFLELISQKKSTVTRAKRSNVLLKIRKGNIVGCTVTLAKNDLYHFLLQLVVTGHPFHSALGMSTSKYQFLDN